MIDFSISGPIFCKERKNSSNRLLKVNKVEEGVLTENSSKCLVNFWIVNKVEEGVLTENSSKRLVNFFAKVNKDKVEEGVLAKNSFKRLVNFWKINNVEEGVLSFDRKFVKMSCESLNSKQSWRRRFDRKLVKTSWGFFCKDKQRQSWRRRFDRKLTTYLTILNDGDFSWYEEIEMGCGLARLRHSTKLFLSHVFLLSSDLSTPLTFVKPFSFFCTARMRVQTSKTLLLVTHNGSKLSRLGIQFIKFHRI